MPITLLPISRRRFLAESLAAGAALWFERSTIAAPQVDPHRLALLSDTHIDADPTAKDRGVTMFDHLQRVRAEVLSLDPPPAAVVVNGDCAHLMGQGGDYQRFIESLQPFREHGLPIHLTMGNHDNRQRLWTTIPAAERHVDPLPDRQIMVLEYPRANLFLLDSLQRTNFTPGALGEKQIQWLSQALDERKNKPAIVMVHHDPDERANTGGLTDTQALLDVLLPRKHVKALFYGHTHHWDVTHRAGLHCVNLPAVAYVFHEGDPSGWVDAHLREDGMSLEVRCLDVTHHAHGQRVELAWRD